MLNKRALITGGTIGIGAAIAIDLARKGCDVADYLCRAAPPPRVPCVAPGVIRTRFHEKMTPAAQAHNLAVRIPLHREGNPEDVAEAVRLLVTNQFITGETIVIDGGTSMQVCR